MATSEQLKRLGEAVESWHEQARKELEAEASFLEKIRDSADDVGIARYGAGARYSDLIADTIRELTA